MADLTEVGVAECTKGIMEPGTARSGVSFKGTAGLVVAVGVVVLLLIAFPAYRVFFAISVGIGVGVAAVLFLWHKLRPIREEDVENKNPLGLK
jgi:hypothetical protein